MKKLVSVIKEFLADKCEKEWFEVKEDWYEPNQLGEYISSLSNVAAMKGEDYAYMVWGVNDKTFKVTGTEFDYNKKYKEEPLIHYLARLLVPYVDFEFKKVEIDGKRLVVLIVPAATKAPVAFNGIRYYRLGSSKINLSKYPDIEARLFGILNYGIPNMVKEKCFDQDLSFKRLTNYYEDRGIHLNKQNFKNNLHLLNEDGVYNKLAELLADNNRISMRVSIFTGKDKASRLYSVREFGNTCLLTALDKILDFGDLLNVPQADERNRIVERKEVMLFNQDAFREAVINAYVHNDWMDNNAPMISVFSDRIEILSRGGMPAEQTKEDFFKGVSRPVNEELANIFLQLHISERSGRGVPKIIKIYGKKAYEFEKNYIVVTIPFESVNYDEPAVNMGKNEHQVKLDSVSRLIIDAMRDNCNITHDQLVRDVGVSKITIYRKIKSLKDNMYIERVGSDKKGWWKILI